MYNKNINLNLYKTFYDVAKYGNISETAKQTYSSQSAISKAIKKLEEELDVTLFYRNKNGVELSEKGKELLFFVEKSFNNLMIAERNMVELSNLETGKLSVGMPSNIGTFYLFDKLIEFHKIYPNIEISIITGSTSKLMKLLESHTVDFVIDTSPINIQDKDVIIDKIKTVNYCFFSSSKLNIKTLKELVTKQLILPIANTANRTDLDKVFLENKVEVNNVLNIHTSEMIIGAVKKKLGIGYVIENQIEQELNNKELYKIELQEKLPSTDINIIYNPIYLTKAPITFISDYLKEITLKK